MKLFKVLLETTNGLKDTARGKDNEFIDVKNGFIYVSREDLEYVMNNYKFESIKAVGLIFERPVEKMKGEQIEVLLSELEKKDKIIEDIKFINNNNKPHIAQQKIREYFTDKTIIDYLDGTVIK